MLSHFQSSGRSRRPRRSGCRSAASAPPRPAAQDWAAFRRWGPPADAAPRPAQYPADQHRKPRGRPRARRRRRVRRRATPPVRVPLPGPAARCARARGQAGGGPPRCAARSGRRRTPRGAPRRRRPPRPTAPLRPPPHPHEPGCGRNHGRSDARTPPERRGRAARRRPAAWPPSPRRRTCRTAPNAAHTRTGAAASAAPMPAGTGRRKAMPRAGDGPRLSSPNVVGRLNRSRSPGTIFHGRSVSATASTISPIVANTRAPARSSAARFEPMVPLSPWIIAPAWPMTMPSRAVAPAISTNTGRS